VIKLFILHTIIFLFFPLLPELADRYGSPKCCAYAMDKILAVVWGADLIADVSDVVILLMDSLGGMPEHVALKEVVMTKLMGSFGALSATFWSGPMYERWCKLTWPVVLAFLQDPRLKTYCEDTIVFAVGSWLDRNSPLQDSPQYQQAQDDLVNKILRVAHVSPRMLGSLVKVDCWTLKRHWRSTML
jgi:hypothetical protein